MSRSMPPLAAQLTAELAVAGDIAAMATRLRASAAIGAEVRKELTIHRTNLVYELAYLKVFNQWEVFLEEVFLRYLCGYRFHGSSETPLAAVCATIADARARVYRTNQYLLWHSPAKVLARANAHFAEGNRVASVVGSALADIERYGHIRHRVAHDQADARQKFDTASMHLAARRFPGSRPGAFLRSMTLYNGMHSTWLERISGELSTLAAQLAP